MKNLNLLAEFIGFLSGCLLLWPAIAQNVSLRRVMLLTTQFAASKTGLGKFMRRSPAVAAANQPQWSRLEQWLLTSGAVTLVLSFLLKTYVVWQTT